MKVWVRHAKEPEQYDQFRRFIMVLQYPLLYQEVGQNDEANSPRGLNIQCYTLYVSLSISSM